MPQPIQSNSTSNFTPYDPSEQMSRADGSSAGAGGASGSGYTGGSEGAASVSGSSPATHDPPSCLPEALKAAGSCGAALLLSRIPTPATLFAGLACAGNALSLVECLTDSKPKAEAP